MTTVICRLEEIVQSERKSTPNLDKEIENPPDGPRVACPMFRLYSRGCQYALRALTAVVMGNVNERFQATTVRKRTPVPLGGAGEGVRPGHRAEP